MSKSNTELSSTVCFTGSLKTEKEKKKFRINLSPVRKKNVNDEPIVVPGLLHKSMSKIDDIWLTLEATHVLRNHHVKK